MTPKFLFAAALLVLAETFTYAATAIVHGPMLGRVTESSIVVWARTARPGAFTVRYGVHPAELTGRAAVVTTVLARDLTNSVRIEGLKADTRY